MSHSFMSRSFRFVVGLAALLTTIGLMVLSAAAQTMGAPEKYTASAIDINNGKAGNINITVDRWSTDKQRDTLMAVALSKGTDKLLDALQEMPRMGYFGAPGNLGWDIHFARKMPLPDGGERIVLITDRRISFWEQTNQPRSINYPFTVIELRVNADGEGEGSMSLATKVIVDKEQNMVSLENLANQPVRLTNIKRERVTH